MSKEMLTSLSGALHIGKQGHLYIKLSHKEGLTCIADSYCVAPLKVAKPFYLDATGEIFIYIMNPTGGMVQGDRYRLDVSLEPGAQAFLTSQAATKIYRMEYDYAAVTECFKVGEGALLEYFPDPVIPFAGSRFVGETEIIIERGGSAFIGEILFPGRLKRGELFQYDFYSRRTRVFYQGELVYYDFFDLRPKDKKVDVLGIFEGYTYYGQLAIFSSAVTRELSDLLHLALQDTPGLTGSASLTQKYGVIVRILGSNSIKLASALTKCWDVARKFLLGRPAPKIRKY